MQSNISLDLSKNDYQYLIMLLPNNEQFIFLRENVVDKPYGRKHLEMSRDQNAMLVDKLFEILTQKGLKETCEPNDLGYLIENLIDITGRHLNE